MRVSGGASFAGTETLLVDGNNLLHMLAGGVDSGALRLLLARLRDALPETVGATLMLDGHPVSGTDRRQRVARNLEIRHSGSISADDALLNMVRDVPPGARSTTTVVTNDRALIERARHMGAHTQRLAWLVGLLGQGAAGSGATIGSKRRPTAPPMPVRDEDERVPWQPGRGATKKRGNPRRTAR